MTWDDLETIYAAAKERALNAEREWARAEKYLRDLERKRGQFIAAFDVTDQEARRADDER